MRNQKLTAHCWICYHKLYKRFKFTKKNINPYSQQFTSILLQSKADSDISQHTRKRSIKESQLVG